MEEIAYVDSICIWSALFAGLTSILAKCGIKNTDSNAATAIRTIIVLIFSWIMVFLVGAQHGIGSVSAKTWTFLILSGLATGASGCAITVRCRMVWQVFVVPIDKLSILVTILFSYLVFHEKLGKKEAGGLVLIVVGTLGMLV